MEEIYGNSCVIALTQKCNLKIFISILILDVIRSNFLNLNDPVIKRTFTDGKFRKKTGDF